jgi:hypothetical protein
MAPDSHQQGAFLWIEEPNYRILIMNLNHPGPLPGKVNVELHLDDGRRYFATFCTLDHLHWMIEKDEATGTGRAGLYFPCQDMVLVHRLSPETIAETVAHVIAMGELEWTFLRDSEYRARCQATDRAS